MSQQSPPSGPRPDRLSRYAGIAGIVAAVLALLALIPTIFMWHPWSNAASPIRSSPPHARLPGEGRTPPSPTHLTPGPSPVVLWVPLSAGSWRGFGIARTSVVSGGTMQISFGQPLTLENKWAGAIAQIPTSCHYEIELQARVVSQVGSSQGGYGVALGKLGSGEVPIGTAFQYDFGFGGYRELVYPEDFQQAYQSWSTPLDHAWHQLKLIFSNGITAYIDGIRIFTYSGVPSCGVPIIRVWSASAEFRNIQVAQI
jgi:hypothetical protein